jgi:hypothetical protein
MESKGPLVVRWHTVELEAPRAGLLQLAAVELENAGSATWRTRGHEDGLFLSYHWLDDRGNPIEWDGVRTPLASPVEPGARLRHELRIRGPIPPGPYRLAIDLIEENRFWLAELGNAPLERDVEVEPRDASAARQYLGDGVEPTPEWAEQVEALHAEGYTAVGGSLAVEKRPLRRADPALAPYAPGGGRNPAFGHPLVCPSLLPPLEPNAQVGGLPAWRPEGDEPWMYDARATLRLRSQSGRRRG